MNGPLAFAFGAGMLSTVNPCGFAMLPAFLAYYLGQDTLSGDPKTGRLGLLRRAANGLRTGILISLGFAAVFTVTGLLVAVGLRSVIDAVPWVAVIIGVTLTVVGIAMVAGRHIGLSVSSQRFTRDGRGPAAMLAFGAAYAVASLSCTLAVLLAVIAQALAAHSVTALISVFVAYAAGASSVLVLLALSAALASSAMATGLRRISRYLPRVAGAVLVASGVYLIAYWVPALDGGGPNETVAGVTIPLSSNVSDFVAAHTTQVAVAALALAATVLITATMSRRQTAISARESPPTKDAVKVTDPD